MATADLKPLLKRATKGPVPVALSMTTDGEGLILAARKGSPKKTLKTLREEAKKNKLTLKPAMPFFGRATIMDGDAGKLVFVVNKAPPAALRPALLKLTRPCGFGDIEFLVNEGIEDEAEDNEAENNEAEDNEAEENDGEAILPLAGQPQADAPIPDAPPPPPPPTPTPADMSGFRADLAKLIPQIPAAAGADASKMDQLKQLAGAANQAIRANDSDAAGAAIERLREAMVPSTSQQRPDTASPAPQPAAGKPAAASGNFVTMQKSRLIWDSARKKVSGEIRAFKTAVRAELDGDPEEAIVIDALGQLDDILANLDERLLDILDEALNAADPAARSALNEDAKAVIAEYLAYTQSNPLLQQLDGDTPFGMKLSINTTMAATLKALQASLR
jgi:hypothetical protein